MLLRHLELRNHRNYAHLELDPGPGVNVFLGANGQGKTNLLESVAMLALSSSPRARREIDLIGPVAPESRIQASVESGGRNLEVMISLVADGERARRTIEVDGVRRRSVDLPGHLRVTLFWPDDLGLVKAGPELRRRFLNHMLVQVEPGYAVALAGLKRVLEQRNHLLKQIAGRGGALGSGFAGPGGQLELEAWDEELVKFSSVIVTARERAVRELRPDAASFHSQVAAGETLDVSYQGPPDDLAAALRQALPEDLRRGSTSVGPHRDDIEVLLDGKQARAFGSQGQQRTAVVSLKLAEAELIAGRTGERPVLLLDDVLSELDVERRTALLSQVERGGQVVITAVESESFPPDLIAGARVWTVIAGRIESCG